MPETEFDRKHCLTGGVIPEELLTLVTTKIGVCLISLVTKSTKSGSLTCTYTGLVYILNPLLGVEVPPAE